MAGGLFFAQKLCNAVLTACEHPHLGKEREAWIGIGRRVPRGRPSVKSSGVSRPAEQQPRGQADLICVGRSSLGGAWAVDLATAV